MINLYRDTTEDENLPCKHCRYCAPNAALMWYVYGSENDRAKVIRNLETALSYCFNVCDATYSTAESASRWHATMVVRLVHHLQNNFGFSNRQILKITRKVTQMSGRLNAKQKTHKNRSATRSKQNS